LFGRRRLRSAQTLAGAEGVQRWDAAGIASRLAARTARKN